MDGTAGMLDKLVIFGVGLIGGSLALALKRAGAVRHVVGVGRGGENLRKALELGVVDQAETNAAHAIMNAEIIVLATSVAQIPAVMAAIAPHLSKNVIITDVGSTKSDVINNARQQLPQHLTRFIAGHPIAGAEKSGVTAARADLFVSKNVVLTPIAETDPQALEKIRQLWQTAGAKVSEMSAAAHDGIFAAVSHLPHLLAFALVDEIASRPNAAQLFDFAASGFRDFTRIAGSSPEMWRDISLANRDALLNELSSYQNELLRLRTLLEKGDGAGLRALFENASKTRNDWIAKQAAK
jgi:prephenate dehydrogenase